MTPALLAAYVAIVVILGCVRLLAGRLRRARQVMETARACLLVDDDLEAMRLLEAAVGTLDPPVEENLYPRSSRIVGQL